jgi:hypothetical protein
MLLYEKKKNQHPFSTPAGYFREYHGKYRNFSIKKGVRDILLGFGVLQE